MKPGQIVFQGKTKKGKDVIVRYPTKEDVHVLRDYINSLSKEYTFIRFQGEEITLEEEFKYVESILEKIDKNEAVKLLAFHQKLLIGVSDIKLKDKTESHIGLFGLTVGKDFRGEGVGKLLMNLVLEEAKRNIKSLKIVTLGVFANNPIAIKMYKKFGFMEYAKLPKGIMHRGKYIDHIYMHRPLLSDDTP